MLTSGDTLLLLSASGETAELLALLPTAQRLDLKLLALCCAPASTLARTATLTLDLSISEEACPHNLAPTTSTTVMLALGDALALTLSQRRGFAPEHFADLHPGGNLGLKLTRVRDLLHTGDAIPTVAPITLMPDVIYEMSRKKLGLTTVINDHNHLQGIISDGDLRRMLERAGANSLALTAADIMNATPITIPVQHLRLCRPRPHGSPQHHRTHRHHARQRGRRYPPPARPLEAEPLLIDSASFLVVILEGSAFSPLRSVRDRSTHLKPGRSHRHPNRYLERQLRPRPSSTCP